ncbi:hypothetical protein [Saccharopolyspora gloriosae]|uniref:hypothetical protein n=1 Tax=Saccharopolyspora gloriosae TaxID=455344 RepID=UPI001FB5833B|nr:hypothetical protein [Saccharopolyspora gloriosae]
MLVGEAASTPTPVPVRYRAGVVGESRRVVHPAVLELEGAIYLARCGEPLPTSQVEVESQGMPCMKCAALLSLGAAPAHGKRAVRMVGGVIEAA